jgi:hypothetical protein
MDNNEEGISAGFMKMSHKIIRAFSKDGPRKTGRIERGNSRILTEKPEKFEIENRNTRED